MTGVTARSVVLGRDPGERVGADAEALEHGDGIAEVDVHLHVLVVARQEVVVALQNDERAA